MIVHKVSNYKLVSLTNTRASYLSTDPKKQTTIVVKAWQCNKNTFNYLR